MVLGSRRRGAPSSQPPGWATVSPDICPHLHHMAHQVSEHDPCLTGGQNRDWRNTAGVGPSPCLGETQVASQRW